MQRRFPAARAAVVAALAPTLIALAGATGPGDLGHDHAGQADKSEERVTLLTPSQSEAIDGFLARTPGAAILADDTNLVDRIYGATIAGGATDELAANAAIESIAGMLGSAAEDLVRTDVIGLMHDATGRPKFQLHRFVQTIDGVEVFRSRVGVLVRNEPGFPVAMVTSDAKPLGDFSPLPNLANADVPAGLRAAIEADAVNGAKTRYLEVRGVVFAGHENAAAAPVDAVTFIAETGDVQRDPFNYDKIRYVVEARTGAIIHEESMVHQVSVDGTVSGNATTGVAKMDCEPEALTGLPYARVDIDGQAFFTDADGVISADVPGTGTIDLNSQLRGMYFEVFNQQSSNSNISQVYTPGSDFSIIHNEANASDERRAEVNTYVEANYIRDEVLRLVPSYPVIGGQTGFSINVNIADTCNAFYNGSSINFFQAGGGCANTSFASVIYHEYGHHLVNTGGSGQGAYGEGMSDTVSALLLDDPRLGLGFNGGCTSPLRNADNNCQYSASNCSSCGSAIHSCGQLISGAVWDTRLNLESGLGGDARDYALQLALNSIILHTGSGIDSSITIDFLTLDDDDASIGNGTPNYLAIANGFGVHNMPAPPLDLVTFGTPDGLPGSVSPSGGTELRFTVVPVTDSPTPGTIVLKTVNPNQTIVAVPTGNADEYVAAFPARACGETIEFYLESGTAGGEIATFPADAPFERLSTVSAESFTVTFDDDFETNQGWSVENYGGLSDGAWTRGVPAGGGDRGDPPADADGSSRAYVTDNADGNSDVDGGGTRLVSPVMDAAADGSVISYYRWYSNTFGASPEADIFEVEVSDNGGSTWQDLETVGPGGAEVDGGWFLKQFNLADLAGFELNDQFRIRFTASDLGDGSVVEAGVDGVQLVEIGCEPTSIPGDVDGNGTVDFQDLIALLASWGTCAGCPADLDGSGTVDFTDLIELLTLL